MDGKTNRVSLPFISPVTHQNAERYLAERLSECVHDPLEFARRAFWSVDELSQGLGPRTWQGEVLDYIGNHLRNPAMRFEPCCIAIASGHDIGKSACISMVLSWAMSTCLDCRAVVTANTGTQLATKTVPEVTKWFNTAINKHWFQLKATSITSRLESHERTWRTDFTTWSITNTDAFAGLHNKDKRIVIVLDEASSIADVIWEVTEGVTLDENTEIIWLAFGNPTQATGRFRECFGARRHRWHTMQIDSRTVEGVNKKQIAKWLEDYGEDSDFFRVRVRGIFPITSDRQFIDTERVDAAERREARCLSDDALIVGVDVSRGGAAETVIRYRKGYDARTIPCRRLRGADARDSMLLVSILVELLDSKVNYIDMMFVDAGFGGPVVDRLKQLGYSGRVMEINFGGGSPDPHEENMRAFMWRKMKDWLELGAIENDQKEASLPRQLCGPQFHHNRRDKLVLEPKESMEKRGIPSPDDADALALTFAQVVRPKEKEAPTMPRMFVPGEQDHSWMS